MAFAAAATVVPATLCFSTIGRAASHLTTRRQLPVIVARRMRPRPGFPAPKFGTRLAPAALFGERAFINTNVGFALASTGNAQVPARTTDGGQVWTIDGPQVHADAADGAEGVCCVGIVSARAEFVYGASVVDVTTDAGHTWWEAYLGENVSAVVPGVHGLVAFVQQSASNQHLNPIVTRQYVSTDGGHRWRYSNSLAAIG